MPFSLMLKINYKNFHITITKKFVILNFYCLPTSLRISGKIPCPYFSLLLLLLTASRGFLSETLENDVHFFRKCQSVPSTLLVTERFLVW